MSPDPSGFLNILDETPSSQPGKVGVFTLSLPIRSTLPVTIVTAQSLQLERLQIGRPRLF